MLIAPLLNVERVSAAVRCETQYGGGQVCVKTGQLQINKQVCDPDKGKCEVGTSDLANFFVDNLGLNQHRFNTGEHVLFRLTVKNVGDETINRVTVTDSLPSQLSLVEGNLSQEITNLSAGQSQDIYVRAKVNSNDKVACVVNTAKAVSGDMSDQDTSQVCLEGKPGELPKAGPADWFLTLVLSVFAATGGFYLLKTAKAKAEY